MYKKSIAHFIVLTTLLVALGISTTFFSAYIIRPPYSSVIVYNINHDFRMQKNEKDKYADLLHSVDEYAKEHEINLFGLTHKKNILYYAGNRQYLAPYIMESDFIGTGEGVYVGQHSPLYAYFVDKGRLKLSESTLDLDGIFQEKRNDFLFEIIGSSDLLIPVNSNLRDAKTEIVLWYVPNAFVVDFMNILEADFPNYKIISHSPFVKGWGPYLKDSFSGSYSISLLALSLALIVSSVYYTLRYYREREVFLKVHRAFGRSEKREFWSQLALHGVCFVLGSIAVALYSYYVRFGSFIVWRSTLLILILVNFLIGFILPLVLILTMLRSARRA